MDPTIPGLRTIRDTPAHSRTLWCPCGATFNCAETRGCAAECPWVDGCGPSRAGLGRARDSSDRLFSAQCPSCAGIRSYRSDGYPEPF